VLDVRPRQEAVNAYRTAPRGQRRYVT
jgi:hypothetical protein